MSRYKDITNKYLLALREGNKDEFAQFYDDMKGEFARIALRVLFDKSLLRDVLSESYIKISKNISKFNHLKDGYNWILKIIENTAKDFNTKESKYVRFEIENLYIADDHDSFAEVEVEMDLRKALKDYNESYLQIALLLIKGGRTQAEIAKMMGVSNAAVCQKVKKIQKVLEKYRRK